MTGPEVWREFAHDPRSPDVAPMRASDADRDIVLGELPVLLEDLVPQTALVRRAGVPDTATMQEQAVARWERSRGEAFMAS